MERISRRDFLRLSFAMAGSSMVAGCVPFLSEITGQLSLEEKLEDKFPELRDKPIVEAFEIKTQGRMHVVNYDPSIKLNPEGIRTLLEYYQQEMPGRKVFNSNTNGKIIPVSAENRTHENQIFVVMPESTDFPRPAWNRRGNYPGMTSTRADRSLSASYVRVPSGDILAATLAIGTELAQATLQTSYTDPNWPVDMTDTINVGLGIGFWGRQQTMDFQHYLQTIGTNPMPFPPNGEKSVAWPVTKEVYESMPLEPLVVLSVKALNINRNVDFEC